MFMSKKTFRLPIAKCLRCGHTWTPRGAEVTICPSCKSPYWNKIKVEKDPENLVTKSLENSK